MSAVLTNNKLWRCTAKHHCYFVLAVNPRSLIVHGLDVFRRVRRRQVSVLLTPETQAQLLHLRGIKHLWWAILSYIRVSGEVGPATRCPSVHTPPVTLCNDHPLHLSAVTALSLLRRCSASLK